MTAPRGDCDPGYLCNGYGSYTSQPSKNDFPPIPNDPYDPADPSVVPVDFLKVGEICPSGFYCEAGNPDPVSCPPGTFSPYPGQLNAQYCTNCPARVYCDGSDPTQAGVPCEAGYFCPEATGDYTVNPCEKGNFCPEESSDQIRCPQGTFQDETIQSVCKPCEAGFYCDVSPDSVSGLTEMVQTCPAGSYCPQFSTASTGLELILFENNTQNYIGITDSDGTFGTFDPSGILCPAGTYQPFSQKSTETDCLACPAGKFCDIDGIGDDVIVLSNYDCTPGYICTQNAVSETPDDGGFTECTDGSLTCTGYKCPTGHYCPDVSLVPVKCPAGTFNSEELQFGLDSCLACTEGYYCENEGNTDPTGLCQAGYFCPESSIQKDPPGNECRIGFYCPEGAVSEFACEDGRFQNETQQADCKTCPDGYTCPFTCSNQGITDNNDDGNCLIECETGHYCIAGNEIACPAGTYNSFTTKTSIEDCVECDAGEVCQPGTTTPSIKTEPGYFSTGGARISNPSSKQESRSDNFLDDCNQECAGQTGNATCSVYCLTNTCNECGFCPIGYFCPENTSNPIANPCPVGTYGGEIALSDESECSDCPAGKFCENSGMSVSDLSGVSNNCDAGYVCETACQDKTGTMPADCGRECKSMHYCPSGATTDIPCADGFESETTSETCTACEQGYICTSTIKSDCQPGFYCPTGTGNIDSHIGPIACPAGTFSNSTNAYEENCTGNNLDCCQNCPSGFYCANGGVITPEVCPEGYFCDENAEVGVDSNKLCPVNSCCDAGSKAGELENCPDGKWCPVEGLTCSEVSSEGSYSGG